MRTNFNNDALADPILAEVERNLRACVHCGICTATCPTYVLLGDERDSPRGRIVMMQQMLEQGGAPSPETVRHVDRCLSCFGCRTACPSSVDYARLVDTARVHIETHYRRPWGERLMRAFIAHALSRRGIAKTAVAMARTFGPVARRLPGLLGRLARIATYPPSARFAGISRVNGGEKEPDDGFPPPFTGEVANERSERGGGGIEPIKTTHRVALLPGCVQPALAPHIDEAVARVLARRDIAVMPLRKAGCCGALAHHLGRREDAKASARKTIAAFEAASRDAPVEAVSISATGCAAHLMDYPHLFADEPAWRKRAEAFVERVRDFSTLAKPRKTNPPKRLKVAYQAPCSLQHGLRQSGDGEAQLHAAGFDVVAIPEGYLCCGSAGSYSILQPDISGALRTRKLANIAASNADAVASPNIGCLMHLAGPDAPPVVHPAELIDWAEGGPLPVALQTLPGPEGPV